MASQEAGALAGAGTLNVSGALIKSAPGTLALNQIVNNSGLVDVQAGTLNLAGGGTHTGPAFSDFLMGFQADLSGVPGRKVDKHSTGGVGDKVSLPLAPLLACLGFRVPMISGRGLGITGGTLDKLESIPGFSTQLPPRRLVEQVQRLGVAMGGSSDAAVETADLVLASGDPLAVPAALAVLLLAAGWARAAAPEAIKMPLHVDGAAVVDGGDLVDAIGKQEAAIEGRDPRLLRRLGQGRQAERLRGLNHSTGRAQRPLGWPRPGRRRPRPRDRNPRDGA